MVIIGLNGLVPKETDSNDMIKLKFKIKFKISNLDKTVDTQIAGKPTQAGKIHNGPAVHNTKLHEMKQHERQPTPKKLRDLQPIRKRAKCISTPKQNKNIHRFHVKITASLANVYIT
ncbi:hypothetical protein MTR_8g487720 [Medicago truncatula]|uniref:Uncharacterized protein n=1 Tax=Medicago truncatula TaxID=3880 RepID=A0A072U4D4_MEDTR|nr:hypothetical protein MTR_8g487720 [Medicago truncatula]